MFGFLKRSKSPQIPNELAYKDIKFILVKGGSFKMGSYDFEDASPIRRVYIDDFYMGKYQITNKQYAYFLNEYGSDKVKSGKYKNKEMSYSDDLEKSSGLWKPKTGLENHPVSEVTWYGANEFCLFYELRLPTEAEWEFTAKGGKKSKSYKYSGGNNIDEVAWHHDNSEGQTHPVGKKMPNTLDIYDQSGNVWELCADWYDEDYYKESPEKNPKGPQNGEYLVCRGGSWYAASNYNRLTYRDKMEPFNNGPDIGFRCVKDT